MRRRWWGAVIAMALAASMLGPADAAAAEKPEKSASAGKHIAKKPGNKHALGDWDEGAKDPRWFLSRRADRPHAPDDWRLHMGAAIGGTVFSHQLDLGAANYDMRLTPHGAVSYLGWLGWDIGRWVSLVGHGSYTTSTFFEGGDYAHIFTVTMSIAGRYGGFFHPQWEVFGELGGGVIALANEPDYVGRDIDAVFRSSVGTRFVGGWVIPKVAVSVLVGDGFAAQSSSVSWQFEVGFGVPIVVW